ncbi:diguanylate cyclase (GGDEF)-like protein [Sphingomonas zeicaulis]|uniref:GGDEF domain-containing protein n=1 Tax=Sphingomonas zeicaulis TaxID=1632740 RepID=UPI003D1D871E
MFKLPDLETLRLCSTVATMAFAIVFAVLWIARRSETPLLYWSASMGIYGLVLIAFGYMPHDAWLGVCALMIVFAFTNILVLAGVRRFEGLPPFQLWMLVPMLLPATGHALAELLPTPADSFSAVLLDGADGLGLLMSIMIIAGATLLGHRGRPSRGRTIAAVALFGYVPAYVIAAILGQGAASPDIVAIIPLLADQIFLGVLSLALLSMVGERALEQLRQAALRDPLTGAWNRAGLAAAQTRLLIEGTVVVAVDIDHFKAINDRHGHDAGDQVLITLSHHACALADQLGGSFARVGGDEFVAILPPGTDAHRFADRLCALGRRHPVHQGAWTISIGLALVQAGDTNFHEARHRADGRLYAAKAAGRDQVAA